MNTSATTNQTAKNLTLFLSGALLATGVLLVLYFTMPLENTQDQVELSTEVPFMTTQITNDSPVPVSPTNGIYTVSSITEIFTNYSGSFDRYAALYALVSRSDEKEIVELFEETLDKRLSKDDSGYLDGFRRTILSKLVQLNPDIASSLYQNLDTDLQTPLTYSLTREWANVDLDSVVDFVIQMSDPNKMMASRGVLDAMSALATTEELTNLATRLGNSQYIQSRASDLMSREAENPREAWEKLLKEPSLLTHDNFARVNNIVNAWIKQEGIAVLDTVTPDIEDEKLRKSIITLGVQMEAEDNPAAAFDYALQFQSEETGFFGLSMSYNPHMFGVLREWIEQEPMDAINRILAVESSTQKASLLGDAFEQWARTDVQTLVTSIQTFPPETRDIARVKSISRLARESIDDAVALFEEIESDAQKTQAGFSITTTWTEDDPEAALKWAQTSSHTESIRSQLTSQIISSLTHTNPQKAFDIAREMPIDEVDGSGVGLEAQVISSLAYTNLDKALELLPNVRVGKTQTTAYMGIGGGLAMSGRVTEAIELGQELSEEDQLSYYTSVGTMSLTGGMVGGLLSGLTGEETEETDIFDTIDSIPHQGAQSQVAMQAIIMDKMSNSYSEEEIERLQKYLSEEDKEELEKGLKQMESMPTMPFFGF
ncbi:MAG: hypothetical protein OXO49_08385 [Gammaproteobacteria bacterium]|nr:hypothetical protein [Gammaproteobacteria bacterium]MDE0252961.1 hypothetical protein [Gammaproteobacteria bacterium]MDE0403644.1 hypothetical protein [Gammaproteobacteria bacterium]